MLTLEQVQKLAADAMPDDAPDHFKTLVGGALIDFGKVIAIETLRQFVKDPIEMHTAVADQMEALGEVKFVPIMRAMIAAAKGEAAEMPSLETLLTVTKDPLNSAKGGMKL